MLHYLGKFDWLIIASGLLLTLISLLMIFSTSVNQTGTDWSFLVRQLIYLAVALIAFFIVSWSDYRLLVNYSPIFYLILVVSLVVTFLIGIETRGSVRWIDFGFFTLQPSEFAKPVLILFLSFFFSRYSAKQLKHFLLSIAFVAVPFVLILNQPDLGSSLVLGAIWVTIVFVAGTPILYLLLTAVLPVVSFPFFWNLLKEYQRERLVSFLNPGKDPLGSGYNLVQSIIAVGSGQLLGQGLGRGTQSHLNFLPEQKTDFIFATIAEELGFAGATLVLGFFVLLLYRLFRVLASLKEQMGVYIIVGVIAVVITQAFINIGMNLGLLPITGITLPFVSFGGSSLVSMFVLLGLVESILITHKKEV